MKKLTQLLTFFTMLFAFAGPAVVLSGCGDESAGEKIEEGAEEVQDEVDDAT